MAEKCMVEKWACPHCGAENESAPLLERDHGCKVFLCSKPGCGKKSFKPTQRVVLASSPPAP